MSDKPLTPEQLICQMSKGELMELLDDLGMESTPEMAAGIKSMIQELGSLERAIDALGGHPLTKRAA